jgi:hypothetical protein
MNTPCCPENNYPKDNWKLARKANNCHPSQAKLGCSSVTFVAVADIIWVV